LNRFDSSSLNADLIKVIIYEDCIKKEVYILLWIISNRRFILEEISFENFNKLRKTNLLYHNGQVPTYNDVTADAATAIINSNSDNIFIDTTLNDIDANIEVNNLFSYIK